MNPYLLDKEEIKKLNSLGIRVLLSFLWVKAKQWSKMWYKSIFLWRYSNERYRIVYSAFKERLVCLHALCSVYDHREQRTWRHLDTMQFKTRLIAQVLRIHCKEHGIKSLKVLMADTQARFTHLFERFAIDVLSACSNKTQATKLLGLSWDEVHYIQSRTVKRGMDRRSVEKVKHVGIDDLVGSRYT